MEHRFYHDCAEMDHACAVVDEMLATYVPLWLDMGYEIIVTADHEQDERGHHGGTDDLQRLTALYYFGSAKTPKIEIVIDQVQLAPTILSRLGVPLPSTMTGTVFLKWDLKDGP